MAKKAMIEREKKRQRLVEKYAAKRAELKEIAKDETLSMEERFKARLKLAKLPRNSAANRMHNRCQLTGRPHAYYLGKIAAQQRCEQNAQPLPAYRTPSCVLSEAENFADCAS